MAPTLAVYSDEKYAENLASTKKRIGNSNQMQSNKTPLRSLRKARRDDATSLSTVEKMDQPFKSLHRRLHDDGKDHKQDTTTRDKENYANAASSHGRHKWPQASTTTSKASSIYTPNLAVAAPQTPYLLLSLEMNRSTSDGADDSLLFSPAPPHVFQTKKRLSLQPTRLKSPPERIPAVSNVSSDRHIVLAASPADSADAFQRQEQESKLHHEEISTHATKAAFSNANHQTDPGACGLTMGVSRAPLTVRTNETKRSKPFKQNSKSNEVEVATFAQTSKPAEQTKFEADALTKVQLETVNTTTKRSIRPTACQSTAEPITVEIEASTSLHQAQVNDLETTVNRLKLPLIAAHRGSMTALGRNVASLTHSRQLPVETPLMHSPDVAALTESVACVKHWSTAKLPCSVLHPTRPATPLTTRGNGVCMDLSGVFFDAAQKTATKPPRNSSASMKGNTKIAVAEKQIVLENKQIGNEQADKQVQALTKWLNYLFYPSESIGEENTVEEENSRLALRSLVLHQRMAKGRLAAAGLYRSSDMVSVRKVVSAEIIRNRIALRTDRDLYANLDHRNKITSLLLSYSAPWLQLGLETVFNTVIHPNRPTQLSPQARHRGAVPVSVKKVPLSRLKLMLKNFIVNSVLSDDKVLAKYTGGKCKVPSGSFGERYRAELRTIVLQRLLVLFFFLDRAKIANVLEKAPTLFTRTSVVKSTRDVLLAFCRDFLKAEGDFVKHLSRVGLHVFFKQEAVNELDFTVTNLRVDLNDGVRLAHMTDLLTGASLLQKLRLPAVSRLQKFHNVGLSLDRLAESGVALNFVAPHHIVDGHREMVLKLLWSVIAHCCLRELLTVHQVQAEIARIQTLHGIPHQQSLRGNKDNLKEVLMQWCDVVCSRFGLAVEDLTNSFADGKAVCYLIHYYHPTLLRVDEIYPTSRDALVKNISSDTLLSNERANGILANSCMSELGGIPEMVPTCDTISPPEEKSMILCLTFLCSRLVESSIEIRASVMIQNCYRGHRTRILRQMKKTAAFRIWSAWRMNKINYYETQKRRFGASVRSIERFLAANRASLQLVRLHRLKWEKSNRAAFLVQVRECAWAR